MRQAWRRDRDEGLDPGIWPDHWPGAEEARVEGNQGR